MPSRTTTTTAAAAAAAEEEEKDDISIPEAPTTINPYAVLSLSPTATQPEIKSAYRKAALLHHPDKAIPESKATAHVKFQEIAFAYAILSDPRRKSRYDTTGRTEESLHLDSDDDFDWLEFFRQQFADVVTEEKIQDFEKGYKGSDEERGHVLQAYVKAKGDMGRVYAEVMLSDVLVDDERFRGWIEEAIAKGEVEGFEKYTKESEKTRKARVASARKRREGFERQAAKTEGDKTEGNGAKRQKNEDGDDLAALIQQRQKGRSDDFFDRLEAKYAPSGKKAKAGAKRSMDEPPEEAFARNAKKSKGEGEIVEGGGRSKRTKDG